MNVPDGILESIVTDYNSLADLMDFFSTPEKPVNTKEFFEFWTSLTYEEMDEYRSMDLAEARRSMRG